MSIALRSVPGPLRTYTNEPALLLPMHAPFTWIISICVAGALFGHIVALRWWVNARRGPSAPLARGAGRAT